LERFLGGSGFDMNEDTSSNYPHIFHILCITYQDTTTCIDSTLVLW
jgi:hypothetical protein